MRLRLHGISHVLSTGCTSSTDAVGYALSLLRSGEYDALLSGGVDACVTPGMMYGFARMRVMATRYNDVPAEASRPFDRGRDGFVLGEGAWMFVLEREDDGARARRRDLRLRRGLRARRATPITGSRWIPTAAQIVRAMRTAVERVRPADRGDWLHQLSRHLHPVERCDRGGVREAALRRRRPSGVPGSSTKSMVGHPQGASGACGIATTALALHRGVLPPTINQRDPDPACDLDFIPNVSRGVRVEAALCNCLGFGSKNSAIVLGSSAPRAQ